MGTTTKKWKKREEKERKKRRKINVRHEADIRIRTGAKPVEYRFK